MQSFKKNKRKMCWEKMYITLLVKSSEYNLI